MARAAHAHRRRDLLSGRRFRAFGAHFACGLLGPLLCDDGISFVKGLYRRPFRVGETTLPDGGGRVTELTARPLLNLFYPDLAGGPPAVGRGGRGPPHAARAPAVRTGYGVDIALLIDAYGAVGLDGLAQVDLDVRQNAHQPLRDLGPMAFAVMRAVSVRLQREGRLAGRCRRVPGARRPELPAVASEPVERPPLATLRAAA